VETKKSNEEENPIVGVPLILKPIGVAIELATIPVGIGHVPVAVGVAEIHIIRRLFHHR
jgi:hypothetical protein